MCVCQTGELRSKFHTLDTFTPHVIPIHLLSVNVFLKKKKVFPDVGSNAAVISLLNGPVVEGDVKVMFESSAVSACIYTSELHVS